MGHNDCAPGDRHCSLKRESKMPACVWVGPKDGGWVKIVDLEEVEPDAPRACAPTDQKTDHGDSVIFAAIASFRDELCASTLRGLFGRATNPWRVRVAIIQQNADGDSDCVEKYCTEAVGVGSRDPCPHLDQIAIKRFDASEAKGPTWARSRDADMLPDDAEFCLRTDSHMAFAQGWDELQIDQWYGAQNEFAVISTYVADAAQIKEDGSMVNINGLWEVPHLCSIQWENGHVRNMQAKAARMLEKPKLTTLWAAGLSFSRCHAERAVPYDPLTPYIFWGEEFSRTARFFTSGYDVYTPPRTLIAHDYKRTQGDPTHFKWNGRGGPKIQQNKTILNMREGANKRIWTLLNMPGGVGTQAARDALQPFGLGDARSLDQLMDFTGIRLTNKTVTANRCGNIDWVPWSCEARHAELDMQRASKGPPILEHPEEVHHQLPPEDDDEDDEDDDDDDEDDDDDDEDDDDDDKSPAVPAIDRMEPAARVGEGAFLRARLHPRLPPGRTPAYITHGALVVMGLAVCLMTRSVWSKAKRQHKKTRGASVSKVV